MRKLILLAVVISVISFLFIGCNNTTKEFIPCVWTDDFKEDDVTNSPPALIVIYLKNLSDDQIHAIREKTLSKEKRDFRVSVLSENLISKYAKENNLLHIKIVFSTDSQLVTKDVILRDKDFIVKDGSILIDTVFSPENVKFIELFQNPESEYCKMFLFT